MTAPDLIQKIDARLLEAKEQRQKLLAAREALTGKRRPGRPRKPNTSPAARQRMALPELDNGLRTRGR